MSNDLPNMTATCGAHLGLQLYQLHVPLVMKFVSLNLLELSWPVQALNGACFYNKTVMTNEHL
jgi:hypothetical protein